MRKILSAIVAVLIAAPSFAQFHTGGFSIDKSNLYFGGRIGFTVPTITGDIPVIDPLGTKVGLNIGAVIGLRVSQTAPVFVESGLFYTERGAKKNKVSVGYNSLEIPLLVKYGFQVSDEIAVLPFFGPAFGFGIAGKFKDENGYKVSSFDDDEPIWPGLKRFNMGLRLGCGAEYNNIYAEIAYQLGVTNISDDDNFSAHSSGLLVNFGVNF